MQMETKLTRASSQTETWKSCANELQQELQRSSLKVKPIPYLSSRVLVQTLRPWNSAQDSEQPKSSSLFGCLECPYQECFAHLARPGTCIRHHGLFHPATSSYKEQFIDLLILVTLSKPKTSRVK